MAAAATNAIVPKVAMDPTTQRRSDICMASFPRNASMETASHGGNMAAGPAGKI